MDQRGVEREKVPSSDCDEDEDYNLLTVINEHSEVIGLIKMTGMPMHKLAKLVSPILMK